MDIGSLLVSNPQSAKLIQPGEGPFHYQSPSTQSTAMLSVTHRQQRKDTAVAQTLADCLRIITTVA